MAAEVGDVVIIGGGIAGISTAYFLGKAGVRSVVVERDSIASHASGFAYGELPPLSGAGIPGPIFALAMEGFHLHAELGRSLQQETGVNTEYRQVPMLSLAFDENEVRQLKAALPWQAQQEGFVVRWLDPKGAREVEPRVSDRALGAVCIEGTAEVEPYRCVLALAQAAESLGATIKHGLAVGLNREGDKVTGVRLESGEIACERVVIAMGPWTSEASPWLGLKLDVRPLKGQILRLRAPGPPFKWSVTWNGNYVTTKPDGLLWAGTTEEEAGFDETPTSEARAGIMASLLKMVPSLLDARLVHQTACLRPVTSDGLPLIGELPGWRDVYVSTGGGRKGILLGPAMGKIMADLIVNGKTDIPIEAFDPGRIGNRG